MTRQLALLVATLSLCAVFQAQVQAQAQAQAQAQSSSVVLSGRMGDKALLMIDGQPQVLTLGQTAAGVRLLRWADDSAVLQHGGKTMNLRLGGSPAQFGGGAAGSGAAATAAERQIVISAGLGGHFVTGGTINGRAVQFMVDTGATNVAMSQVEAVRLGLDMTNAKPGVSMTANGLVPVQQLTLSSVRVGGVQVANVAATIVPAAMPHVLLGNSFLTRFQMRRDNDVMRLELR